MSHDSALAALERAELIRLAQRMPEPEYAFRHALVQDAAYGSLLKTARRDLHAAIGDAIENLYPERVADYAPVIARHFAEAEQFAKALRYYEQAGDVAAAKYANGEAVAQYSSALSMAARTGSPRGELWRKRGRICELGGDPTPARADFEAAASEARLAGDRRAEWRSLVDLGFLWAAQDYAQAGMYFRRAIDLARTLDDRRLLAESLNRLGNWYANTEKPLDAAASHREAMTLYEGLADERGIAETLDLLAMASLLACDLAALVDSARKAVGLFSALNQTREATSALTTLVFRGPIHISDIAVVDSAPLDACGRDVVAALRAARSIGWRSGEADCLLLGGMVAAAAGQWDAALDLARTGLSLAQAIGHSQWQVLACLTLGRIHADLGDWTQSRPALLEAIRRANALGSGNFIRQSTGMYARVAAWLGSAPEQAEAERALDTALGAGASPDGPLTNGQRHCWVGRAELMLARGDATGACAIADALMASLPNRGTWGARHSPRMLLLRGRCLIALERAEAAAHDLRAAREIAAACGARTLEMQAGLHLARAAGGRGDAPDAAARRLAEAMAATIPGAAQRRAYLAHVLRETGA